MKCIETNKNKLKITSKQNIIIVDHFQTVTLIIQNVCKYLIVFGIHEILHLCTVLDN